MEGTRTDLTDDPEVRAFVWHIRDVQDALDASNELRESERRLRALFDSDVVAQAIIDAKGTILAANESFCELLDVTEVEARIHQVADFWASDLSDAREGFRRLLDGEVDDIRIVGRCRRGDGTIPIRAVVRRIPTQGTVRLLVQAQDLREEERNRAELELGRQRLDAVISHAPLVLATFDIQGAIDFFGGHALQGLPEYAGIEGLRVQDVFAGDPAIVDGALRALGGESNSVSVEGEHGVWEVHSRPLCDANGAVTGGVAVAVDITERAAAERATRASEARLHALLTSTADVIAVEDEAGILRYASPSVGRVLGRSAEEVVGRTLFDLVAREDHDALRRARGRWQTGEDATIEVRMQRGDELRVVEVHAADLLDDPAVAGVVLTLSDVTERTRQAEHALYASMHDDLTGLPNRRMLAASGRYLPRRSDTGALLLVDIDGFGLINATYGEQVGDEVLRAVAAQLVASAASDEVVFHLGADEFLVVSHEVVAEGGAQAAAERFVHSISGGETVVDGQAIWLSVSIGVAALEEGVDLTELLQRADAAVRHSKGLGRGMAQCYNDELAGIAGRQLAVESGLRRAIASDELCLQYQPQIDMRSGAIVGVEALVRWNHPELGFLPPSEFLPIAERSALIVSLGRWVLRQACRQAAAWERAWPEHRLVVACNLSARHLLDPGLVGDLEAALEEFRLTPSRLRLEVTETSVMTDADAAVRTLRALKATGVKLSIDDFGTGWSSLAYLKSLPVDELKIDQSFVSGLGVDAGDTVIVEAVVSLARPSASTSWPRAWRHWTRRRPSYSSASATPKGGCGRPPARRTPSTPCSTAPLPSPARPARPRGRRGWPTASRTHPPSDFSPTSCAHRSRPSSAMPTSSPTACSRAAREVIAGRWTRSSETLVPRRPSSRRSATWPCSMTARCRSTSSTSISMPSRHPWWTTCAASRTTRSRCASTGAARSCGSTRCGPGRCCGTWSTTPSASAPRARRSSWPSNAGPWARRCSYRTSVLGSRRRTPPGCSASTPGCRRPGRGPGSGCTWATRSRRRWAAACRTALDPVEGASSSCSCLRPRRTRSDLLAGAVAISDRPPGA